MRKTLLLLLILPYCANLSAQKIDEAHVAFADKMKVAFPEEDVALLSNKSVYQFYYDKALQTIRAKSVDDKELVALEYNAQHTARIYFSDQVGIDNYQLKNLKGRSVSHDKLCGHFSSNGIFHSDAQICAYKISLPEKGEYRLLKANQTYKDVRYLTTAYFHEELPAAKREITFEIPSWAEVELREMNFDGFDIQKRETDDGKVKKITFSIKDIDAFPDEENLPGSSYFLPHIIILTKGYTREGQYQDILGSTQSLYGWYKSLVEGMRSDKTVLEPLVAEITKGHETDEEKIKAIFYWVQDNIRYIAFEQGLAAFRPEDSHKVFNDRFGDCKGMANLTRDMLQIAGFDARLSWIGTNRLAYTYDIPSLAVDNHMICSVNMNGKYLHLDATEKHHSIEDYAERLQGKQVLVEDGDSFVIDKIPTEPLEKYLEEIQVQYEINDNQLTASVIESIDGEFRKILHNVYEAIPKDKTERFYKTIAAGNLERADIELLNDPILERDSVLKLDYRVAMKNHLNKFGDEVYIDLDYKKDLIGRKIEKEREVPYKFDSKIYRRLQGSLTVPEGLAVQHIPDALEIKSDYFEFKMHYQVNGDKIDYSKEMKITKTYLPVDKFELWNDAIEDINKFYNDQIILKAK
ncbi:MAG: transglutaminase-like domain-containing protein [Bacteroidota bacterium]